MASNWSNVTLVCWQASGPPLIPAMNAAIANAVSFVRNTLMPAAAADRSLARTASMAEPSRLVRSLATPSPTMMSMTSTMKQKARRGKAAPAPTSRLSPNSDGATTFAPLLLTKLVFSNQNDSTNTARANVTTANGRPRMRAAGRPTTIPTTMEPSAARTSAIGNGTPQLSVSGLSRNPAQPASTNWASESCPANPVTTTWERAMMAKARLATMAARQDPCKTTNTTTAAAAQTMVGSG